MEFSEEAFSELLGKEVTEVNFCYGSLTINGEKMGLEGETPSDCYTNYIFELTHEDSSKVCINIEAKYDSYGSQETNDISDVPVVQLE